MKNPLMYGIIGDICGSRFEFHVPKDKIFSESNNLIHPDCHFTDDTVHTCALAKAICENYENPDFESYLKSFTKIYPGAGYGPRFLRWVNGASEMNDSFGNGCCMRNSPCMFAYDMNTSELMGYKQTVTSHNHVNSLRAISWMYNPLLVRLYTGLSAKQREFVMSYNNDLSVLMDYAKDYKFDSTVIGSIPEAVMIGFYAVDKLNYEEVIRRAILLGGDTDTQACIAGTVYAYSYFIVHDRLPEISDELYDWAWDKLDVNLRRTLNDYNENFKHLWS